MNGKYIKKSLIKSGKILIIANYKRAIQFPVELTNYYWSGRLGNGNGRARALFSFFRSLRRRSESVLRKSLFNYTN